jgi:endonuclease G
MLGRIDPAWTGDGLQASLERKAGAAGGGQTEARRVKAASLEAEFALESLDVLRRGQALDGDRQYALEAIVLPFYRPVVDVAKDDIRDDQLGAKWADLADGDARERIKAMVQSVGRIGVPALPTLPYAGTGFVAGPNLLMTNRHVAEIFASGRGLKIVTVHTANFDFYRELGQTKKLVAVVETVKLIHPKYDLAVLEITPMDAPRPSLTFATDDPAKLAGRRVAVVGYPGYDPDPDEEFQRVQERIFRGKYYVKRFQPGTITGREPRDGVEVLVHDCSTLGGNSGSAVFDLATGHVLGLHFAGEYLVGNDAVSSADIAADQRLVDLGLNFSGPKVAAKIGPEWAGLA